MKTKKLIFDVEYIHDINITYMNVKQTVSTHRMARGFSLKELIELIKLNNTVPEDEDSKITLNIRGVNY